MSETEYKNYLESDEATKLWADSEDLTALADLYEIVIKVVTSGGSDEKERISYICPNHLVEKVEIPEVLKPIHENKLMTLMHKKDSHFDLIYSEHEEKCSLRKHEQKIKKNDEETKGTEKKDNNSKDVSSGYDKVDEEELDSEITFIKQVYARKRKKVLKCDDCSKIFCTEDEMTSHITKSHGDDGDFNCKQCSFQSNREKLLQDHLIAVHDSGIKCHNCGKYFSTKRDLMYHRKEEHPEKIRSCLYNQNNECNFGEDCWYSHSDKVTNLKQFTCNKCGKKEDNKHDFMKPRKEMRPENQKNCIKNLEGNCHRKKEDCWYKHNETNQDFQKVMQGTLPPDNCNKMFQMIMEKIKLLENNKLQQ